MIQNFFRLIITGLILYLVLIIAGSCRSEQVERNCYTEADFQDVPKIDAHFHYLSWDESYMQFAISENFKLLSPNYQSDESSIKGQLACVSSLAEKYNYDFAYFAGLPADSINSDKYASYTIKYIDQVISSGAAGIKIWKNVGMDLKYPDGRFIMIDDSLFGPIFRFLEDNHIPVIAHLGDPLDSWLPFDKMIDSSDSTYYGNHPEYYMYLHPEVPFYKELIKARDSILARYPDLDFVGAHLGSLEWSIDELARRLDAYPNFNVDLAGRIYFLKHHSKVNYKKVKLFMIKYQDRILYGSDQAVNDLKGSSTTKVCEQMHEVWMDHWMYLATDNENSQYKGLALPREVIDKIYCKNAEKYFR